MSTTITYITWPDTRTAPDWVRVPTIEVFGHLPGHESAFWAFTVSQHPANVGTRTLPDQRPWERDDADQLRLNVFTEGWPALADPTLSTFFATMATRQPTQIGEVAAILAEGGALDSTAASRAIQGLPAEML
ncbi:hypothetical protein [Nocardia fluminea]|uniref:hypothetical protein n=1 Tax=Nocardia fluminea TaxID=134984 RepID=UPI0036642291